MSLVLSASHRENQHTASLERRNGTYGIVFLFEGGKYSRTLKTKDNKAATACLARLEDNLRRVELGTLVPPTDADIASFLLSDGRLASKPTAPRLRSLGELFDAFFVSIPNESIEDSTLYGMRIHVGHWKRLLGESFRIHGVGRGDLQQYVVKRSKERGLHGRNVSTTTIKKELVTLTTVWRWAKEVGIVEKDLPKRGLRFPKTTEKPPFQHGRRSNAGSANASLRAGPKGAMGLPISDGSGN